MANTIFDIPVAGSGYSLAGKKIMVHDLTQPEGTSTKVFNAGLLPVTNADETITGNWDFTNMVKAPTVSYTNPDQDVNNYYAINSDGAYGGYDAQDGTQLWRIGTSGINLHSEQDDVFNVDANGNLVASQVRIYGGSPNQFLMADGSTSAGAAFDPSADETITGNWLFQGDFTVDDGDAAAGFKSNRSAAISSIGDWNQRNFGTVVEVDDNAKSVRVFANKLEGWDLNYEDGNVKGWELHSNGSGNFGGGRVFIHDNGSFSVVNSRGDDALSIFPNPGYYGIGDLGGDKNNTSVLIDDSDGNQTITYNANNGYTFNGGSVTYNNLSNRWLDSDGNKVAQISNDGSANFGNGAVNVTPRGYLTGQVLDEIHGKYLWSIMPSGETKLASCLPNYIMNDDAGNLIEETRGDASAFYFSPLGTFSLGYHLIDDNPDNNSDGDGNITHLYTYEPAISFNGSNVNFAGGAVTIDASGNLIVNSVSLGSSNTDAGIRRDGSIYAVDYTSQNVTLSASGIGDFEINDKISENQTLSTSGNGDFYIQDKVSGNNTLYTDGNGDFYIQDKVSGNNTLYTNSTGYFYIQDKVSGNNTLYTDGTGYFYIQEAVSGNPTLGTDGNGDFYTYDKTTGSHVAGWDSDGAASFAKGAATIDASGNVTANRFQSPQINIWSPDDFNYNNCISSDINSFVFQHQDGGNLSFLIGAVAQFENVSWSVQNKNITVAGLEDLGTYKSGTVSLDTAHYIELKLADGNTYKVLVAN